MASPSSASRTPPSPRSAAAAAAEQSPQTAQLQDVAPPVETHDSKEGIKMLIPKEEPYERKPDLLDPFLGNGSGHARRAPRRGRQVGGSSGGRVEIYDNNNRDGQIKHLDEDYFKALDEKHIRYDAEFSRHLMAKYFSGKAFDGGKVYDQETIIENETIKSSRYPFTSSFADPVRHYEEENRSASPAEENIKCTGQEHPSKKSS
ncbi:uncharacterized protein LOC103717706 isoform X1 [Phoenix dactylifera]|uniref:Uncharacterized protein LOC103717706 isoform X1 n=1 Tax=Phoenix dactylifera TaxID=42345 RepID=A0A8B9AMN1_PHODC|nr:uncharacterized protein LOC103717706 isoform X1 [Phoenix dactylifera]